MRVGLAMLLSCVPAALALAGDRDGDRNRAWARCAEAVDWFHSVEVEGVDDVEHFNVGNHSYWWIRDAIDAAPPPQDWFSAAREAGKLVFWYVPATPGVHLALRPLIDRQMMAGPLSDPDVVALLKRRYVALKLPAAGPLAKKFELTPPRFIEPGFLVLDGNGRVLHRMDRIRTLHADYLRWVLAELANEHLPAPEAATPEEALAAGALDLAERLLDRDGRDDPYQRARLARLRRDGKTALELLDRVGRDARAPGDVATERGLVLLRMGRLDESIAVLRSVFRGLPDAPRNAEAGYLLGAARFARGDRAAALASWGRTATRYPATVWGARARVCGAGDPEADEILGESALVRGMRGVRWLADGAYRLAPDTQWRRTPEDAADIARRAVAFLLGRQGPGGRWTSARPETVTHGDTSGQNFHMAIAALCAAALWEWRAVDPERVDAALAEAETYLLQDDLVTRGDAVLWTYADAFRLLYFSKRLPHLREPRRDFIRRKVWRWTRNLRDHQYYFFHNFYPACLAAVAAGPHGAADRRRLLALLCELPEIDGAFVDAGFRFGRSYATAMALLSLDALLPDRDGPDPD